MEIKHEGSVKIKFSSGREIILTNDEFQEICGFYKQPYVIPDLSTPSKYPWTITYC